MSEPAFELEQAYDRADLAAIVGGIATALEREQTLRVHTPEKRLAVDVPARIVAELEAAYDDDEDDDADDDRGESDAPSVAELELELEWDDPDGSSIRTERLDDDQAASRTGSIAIDGEPSEEPAAATMPPEAVTRQGRSGDEVETKTEQPAAERRSRFEVYQDRAEEWRWRLVHWNGNIIADSGEGYASRSNAKRAVRSVMRVAPAASIEDRES